MKGFSGIIGTASLIAIAVAAPVAAQQAVPANVPAAPGDPTGGEDIVVTALKRPENVQAVPVAINVVSAAALANAGVTKLDDLSKVAPSVSLTPASGQIHSTISMRGVYSNNLAPGIPAAVGVVVDDIAQPPEAQGFNELNDIERIEVLRGPQSTISGRNASAGLINIVTRAPSDHLTAKVDLQTTTDREFRGQLYLSGPIGDTLAASVSAYGNDYRGNVRNTVLDRYNGRSSYGGRIKLRWRPSASFEATLTGFAQHLDDRNAAPITQYYTPGANRRGLAFPAAIGNVVADGSNDQVASPVDGYQRSDSRAVSLRMALDVGRYQLLSISGYQHEKIDQVQDVLGVVQAAIGLTPGFNGTQVATLPTQTFSQELRLVSPAANAFSYVLGLYYLDTTASYDFVRAGLAPFNRLRDTGLDNYAAYVRTNWTLSDALSLTGGVRYNREKIRYALTDRNTPANSSANRDSDDVVLGDVSLTYRVAPDVRFYGRYARGYQGKAYDTDAPVVLANPALAFNAATNPVVPYTALAPEHVDSVELGMKSQFLDRRVTFNVALYDARYANYQAQTRVANSAGLFDFRLFSAGKVETKGVEADVLARIGHSVRVNGALAYTDAKFKNFVNAPCYGGQSAAQGCVGGVQDLSGHGLGYTPAWRAVGGIEYALPIESVHASVRGDASWQDSVNYDVAGGPLTVQPAYAIFNAAASVSDRAERFKVTFFVNNLTNRHYVAQLSDNTTSFSFGAPANTVYHVISTRYLPRDFSRYGGIRLSLDF